MHHRVRLKKRTYRKVRARQARADARRGYDALYRASRSRTDAGGVGLLTSQLSPSAGKQTICTSKRGSARKRARRSASRMRR